MAVGNTLTTKGKKRKEGPFLVDSMLSLILHSLLCPLSHDSVVPFTKGKSKALFPFL